MDRGETLNASHSTYSSINLDYHDASTTYAGNKESLDPQKSPPRSCNRCPAFIDKDVHEDDHTMHANLRHTLGRYIYGENDRAAESGN